MNTVQMTGRLCADPDFRQTPSGIPVCRIRVAVNRRFKNKQTGEYDADFISCTAWRGDAEFISKWFRKGNWIEVCGELRNNNFKDNNGVEHYSMDVLVINAGFVGNAPQNAQGGAQGARTNYGGNYTPQNQTPQNGAQSASAQLGDLGDFEEILGDGDVPF